MHPIRKRRLYAFLFIAGFVCVVLSLVLYAMRQNISLFYTPAQVSKGEAPFGQPIRVGGMVVKKSMHYLNAGHEVEFGITDFVSEIKIRYKGLLPDLFREGQGVVVNGVAQGNALVMATEVLAKHDANYMPPEIRGMVRTEKKT